MGIDRKIQQKSFDNIIMQLDKDFELLTEITDIEPIARGKGVRIRRYLNKTYGRGRWRKLKGRAWIQLKRTGQVQYAELHWYEAQGIGRRDMKRKYKLQEE